MQQNLHRIFVYLSLHMKKSWIIWSILGLMLLHTTACKDDDDKGPDETEIAKQLLAEQIAEIKTYLEQQNITAVPDDEKQTSHGIYREVVVSNPTGEELLDGQVAIVNYKISRLDGTLIGASEPGAPVAIAYSPGKVNYFPLALNYGLKGVRVGEKHRFYVPSRYAYRKYSDGERYEENGIIILEYEILGIYHNWEEITAVEQEAIAAWLEAEGKTEAAVQLNEGVHKVLISEGTGEAPIVSDSVWVSYKGYFLNKEVFDENTEGDFDFKLGFFGENSPIVGFHEAVKSMVVGEKSLFIIPSESAYRNNGTFVLPVADRAEFTEKGAASFSKIPPFTTLAFEIKLEKKKSN